MKDSSGRLLSLDVFRGLTIAGMILVNNPGSWKYVYPPLRHAVWNGCTPTDLIFPFFLFIVGVSISIALSKRKTGIENPKEIYIKIIRRSVLIFVIGLFLNTFPVFDFTVIRIPGVLQRIAVVYLISSLIFIKAEWKFIAILSGLLLFLYWAVMALVPVPGFGAPDLSVPVLTDGAGKIFSPNIGGWIDKAFLDGHLYRATKVWDPEGILSTIPAVSTCLFGILLGKFLQTNIEGRRKTVLVFIAGNVLILTSFIWNIYFPFNKSIWSSSFVLLTGGTALWVFALCYWFADVKKIKWWTKPFTVFGTNAIAVYFLSGIFLRCINFIKITSSNGESIGLSGYIYNSFFVPNFSPFNASLAWAVSYVLFWLVIIWILYAKKIFIRI